MTFNNDKEVQGIQHLSSIVTAVYHMGNLVWIALTSCFSRGFWQADAPWSDTEGWQD